MSCHIVTHTYIYNIIYLIWRTLKPSTYGWCEVGLGIWGTNHITYWSKRKRSSRDTWPWLRCVTVRYQWTHRISHILNHFEPYPHGPVLTVLTILHSTSATPMLAQMLIPWAHPMTWVPLVHLHMHTMSWRKKSGALARIGSSILICRIPRCVSIVFNHYVTNWKNMGYPGYPFLAQVLYNDGARI